MKVLRWLDENFEKSICIMLFIAFLALMVVNIIMRYVFKSSIAWATEAITFIAVWFVCFAMSYGFKEGAHVAVTFVADLFPFIVRKIIVLISQLVMLALLVYLAYTGFLLLGDVSIAGKFGLLIPYPMWTFYCALPVGCVCSVFRIAQNFVKELKVRPTEEEN